MAHEKFDVSRLARLDDPARFDSVSPEVVWEAVGVAAPSVVVEIGAGTGLYAQRLSEMAPEATVYAVDIEQPMLDWMGERRSAVGEGRLVPVLSEEVAVPLPSGAADVVAMLNLHHELAQPDQTYHEAARLLRNGGRIVVVDWAARDMPMGPPLRVRVSEQELVLTLANAGFEDIVVHEGVFAHHSMVTGTRP